MQTFGLPPDEQLGRILGQNPYTDLGVAQDARKILGMEKQPQLGQTVDLGLLGKVGIVTSPGSLQVLDTEPKPRVGMEVGKVQALPDGTQIIGKGIGVAPELIRPEKKNEVQALTQTEVDRLGALQQARRDLDNLQQIFANVPPETSGPLLGRLRGKNPYDETNALLEQSINSTVPNLARGVFREVGVLTDEDVKRYKQLLPTLKDPPATRQKKMEALYKRLEEGQRGTLDELQKAGRDVSGYLKQQEAGAAPATEPAKATEQAKYDSEEEARKAGAKAGDIILLYNPKTAKYQRFQLE